MAHSLFQYPAMMVPEVQRRLIEVICAINPNIKTIYDPFVGSGTALVAGLRNGLRGSGQDINPLAILVARVKTHSWNLKVLGKSLDEVTRVASADTRTEIEVAFPGINKWFRIDVQRDLARLRRAILIQPDSIRAFLWVVLAETVRLTSNDRTSTYKLHARPTTESETRQLAALNTFNLLAQRSLSDLREFRSSMITDAIKSKSKGWATPQIKLANTKLGAIPSLTADGKHDLLVTSPPYGDNRTTVPYGEHSYLALQWIPLEDIDQSIPSSILRTTREIDRQSLGGELEKAKLIELVCDLSKRSHTLGEMLKQLSGGPDAAVTRIASFYRDLEQCIINALAVMKPNAYLCWTVAGRRVGGIEVPFDKILKELFAFRNVTYITVIERSIHHKRMPSKNRTAATMKREQILIFRMPIQ
jgi:hypothetical protein